MSEAVVSYWLGGLDGAVVAERAADVQHYAASLMKVPLAIAAYRSADRGELDLDAAVAVHDDFASIVAGERFTLDEADDQDPRTWAALGATLPLRELVRRSLTDSGNLAADLVLERVGLDEVAAVLADAGCSPRTVVRRAIGDVPGLDAGHANLVTARDVGLLLAGLAAGRLASASACAELEEVLGDQVYRDAIPRAMPPSARVANKTGWVDGLRHDAAIVRTSDAEPRVLVVLTTGLDDDTAERQISDLAGELWGRHDEVRQTHPDSFTAISRP
jgi:beta-lactamase class A